MTDEMSDERNLEDAWDRGTPATMARTRRSPTSVLSIRLPNSVLEQLTEIARKKGVTAGALAREILERELANESPATPDAIAKMFARWIEEAIPIESELGVFSTHATGIIAESWIQTSGAVTASLSRRVASDLSLGTNAKTHVESSRTQSAAKADAA